MKPWRRAIALASLLCLGACEGPGRTETAAPPPPPPVPAPAPAPPPVPQPEPAPPPPTPPGRPATGGEAPVKGLPSDSFVQDNVYLPIDRTGHAPSGYALYTVVLARSADPVTTRLLTELLRVTGGAAGSPIPRANLNLITLPVNKAGEAARLLLDARNKPAAVAADLMRTQYDFGEAELLMASVCHSADAKIARACGSPLPTGPLLVTALKPLDGHAPPEPRLLVVNLGSTPPDAVPEVLKVYLRQIVTPDRKWDDPGAIDGWRLRLLDGMLEAANILPLIRKAYAADA